MFIVEYSTCISQSKRSSSFRICSLSCLMSLDLSIVFEFTLKIQTRIIISNFSLWYSLPMVNKYKNDYWKDQRLSSVNAKKKERKRKTKNIQLLVHKTPPDWVSCWPVDCSPLQRHWSVFSEAPTKSSRSQSAQSRRKHVGSALLNNCRNNTSVPVFYAAQWCWIHIQTAWSQSHDRRRFLQTAVSALVYGPACGIQTASAPPGIDAWQDRHIRSQRSCQ